MQVIKKNGSLQEFDKTKLERTIMGASDSIKQRLNSSDVQFLSENIERIIKSIRENNTSSYEVFAVVLYVLKTEGFVDVANSYYKGN